MKIGGLVICEHITRQAAHEAVAYPDLLTMKRLGLFYFPPRPHHPPPMKC